MADLDKDREEVQFVLPDGKRLPMTRAVAETMQNEGRGNIDEQHGVHQVFTPSGQPMLEGVADVPQPQTPLPGPSLGDGRVLELESPADFQRRQGEVRAPQGPDVPEDPTPVVEEPVPAEPEATVSPTTQREPEGGFQSFDAREPEAPPNPLQEVLNAQQRAGELKAEAMRQEAAGNTAAAAVMSRQADEELSNIEERRKELEEEEIELGKEESEQRKRIDSITTDIENTDISDNQGFGEKILGGLMIGLFQMGSTIAGAPGTPNLAMQIIQSNIRRDIDAQKTKLATKKGLLRDAKSELGRLLEQTGDLQSAELLLQASREKQVEKKMEALKMQASGESQRKQADVIIADLKTQQAETLLKAKQKQDEALARRRAQRASLMQKERESKRKFTIEAMKLKLQEAKAQADRGNDFQKKVFAVGKEYIKSGAGEVRTLLTDARTQLAKGKANPNDFVGQVSKKIPLVQRWINQDQQRAIQTQTALKLVFQRALTGKAGNEQEMKEISSVMAVNDWNKSPAMWVNAMNLLERINTRKESEVEGLDPPAFREFIRGVEGAQTRGSTSTLRREQ